MPEHAAPDEHLLTSPRLRVILSPFGARVTSVLAPDRDDRWGEVTLGPADARGWLSDVAYLGASVGRVANRIRHGRFSLDGVEHQLATGPDGHTLHGGPGSFDRRGGAGGHHTRRPGGGGGAPGAVGAA